MTPQLVVGLGEVGQAICEVTGWDGRDIEPVTPDGPRRSLHIATPWFDGFEDTVRNYQTEYAPELVVVHSTVAPGVCDRNGWVHSPVRGRHPQLAASLTTFTKLFGGAQAETAAAEWNTACDSPTATTPRAVTTELGKVWELAHYGTIIAMEKAIHDDCERLGADFDTAYTLMAETYNHGYQQLGHPQFTRPIIKHTPGPIGGHCILPNMTHILHPIADIVRNA